MRIEISNSCVKPVMTRYNEVRIVPFAPDLMFELVADVEAYPKFLPWCIGARVRDRTDQGYLADLIIGFKMLREKYSSHVHLDKTNMAIKIDYLDGPFRHLDNNWKFTQTETGGTQIEFHIDFEFRSRLLQNLIGKMFGEAVSVMVNAFEKRAHELYG